MPCNSPYSFRSFRPRCEPLEDRLTPANPIAFGPEAGGGPHVKVIDVDTGVELHSFFAYDPSFRGGVRLSLGDVTGDGTADVVTAPGKGGGPHVKVFDGNTMQEVRSFFAYDPSVRGGLFVDVGDFDGDRFVDIITASGPGGGPHVRVFSGKDGSEIHSFFAFDPTFAGGVSVSSGDTDGDGRHELIAAAWRGGGPHVKVFDGQTLAEEGSFFAFDAGFSGGVWVCSGDITGDGKDDIIATPGFDAPGQARVFDGATGKLAAEFLASAPGFTGGVRAGSGDDFDADGHDELITVNGPGGRPTVTVWSGITIAEDRAVGRAAARATSRGTFLVFDDSMDTGIIASRTKMIIE
ncbi:MAG TPA: hypothetical protein VIL46_10695, partial [Gemmataceae bacterium]